MISKMTDEDLLDFLMTSEFENDISPDEFRFLLNRWKYFYRDIHGRLERAKQDLSFDVESLRKQLADAEGRHMMALVECARKQDVIDSMKHRKLTLKERLRGKIITEDEDKRIQEA